MRKLLNSELGRKSIEQYRESLRKDFVIVLDNVRSHNNVGSVFRTADAFLTGRILLCGITARQPTVIFRKQLLEPPSRYHGVILRRARMQFRFSGPKVM